MAERSSRRVHHVAVDEANPSTPLTIVTGHNAKAIMDQVFAAAEAGGSAGTIQKNYNNSDFVLGNVKDVLLTPNLIVDGDGSKPVIIAYSGIVLSLTATIPVAMSMRLLENGARVTTRSVTGTDIGFADTNPDTITSTTTDFVAAGFSPGQRIEVTGSASNNRLFTIATVAANTITLIAGDSLTPEGAGASVAVVEEHRFDVNGSGTASESGQSTFHWVVTPGASTTYQLEIDQTDDLIYAAQSFTSIEL